MSAHTPDLHTEQADSHHVVATVWPDLVEDEVAALLTNYPGAEPPYTLGAASTRPLSAATTVTTGGTTIFVKRHHRSVRTGADLATEHAFISHLSDAGLNTPQPLPDNSGKTAVELSWGGHDWTYEVFQLAEGDDRYRGRDTWSAFFTAADARAAGRALAELHLAAAGFDAPARPAAALRSRPHAFGLADDPLAEVEAAAVGLPGLGAYLRGRDWRSDLAPHLEFHRRLQPLLVQHAPLWTHNDWHASNLFFDGDQVSAVIDFGLADRSFAIYDLATALERNTLQWLDLLAGDETAYRLDHAEAFLAGYHSRRPLTALDAATLLALLPLVQADFALTGLDYYHRILGQPSMAQWGYEAFLIDHTVWFLTPSGGSYLHGLEKVLSTL